MGRDAAVDTSIIVCNRNGRDYLVECLASVLDYSQGRFELILVDNASEDGSIEAAVTLFGDDARLRVVYSDHDLGHAEGSNLGLRQARGFFLVLLGAFTRVTPGWLKALLLPLRTGNVNGAAQAKLVSYENPQVLDGAGGQVDMIGTAFERGRWRRDRAGEPDSGQYDAPEFEEIFWASASAMAVRRDVLAKTGYFDPAFRGCLADVDLCWRIRLAGYRVVFAPGSVVYRRLYSESQSDVPAALSEMPSVATADEVYQLNRNQLACLVKYYRLPTLLAVSPLVAAVFGYRSAVGLLRSGPHRAVVPARAAWATLTERRRLLLERRTVRKKVRKVSDRAVMRSMLAPGFFLEPRPRRARDEAGHEALQGRVKKGDARGDR